MMNSVSASDQGILRGPQIMGWTNQNPTAKQRWRESKLYNSIPGGGEVEGLFFRVKTRLLCSPILAPQYEVAPKNGQPMTNFDPSISLQNPLVQ